MLSHQRTRSSFRDSSSKRLPTAVLTAAALSLTCAGFAALLGGQSDAAVEAKCKADLAKRLALKPSGVTVAETKPTVWPSTALGMPEIGKLYADVMTPGARLILTAKGGKHLYTTGKNSFRYGGPISSWSYSWLCLVPVDNEANLNGDLYQCSLIGTNATRIARGLSDFFPQEGGMVLGKRRTSRSGHELLLIDARSAAQPKSLRAAMDFGDAALNVTKRLWAAYIRPALGSKWAVAIGSIDGKSEGSRLVPLPEGVNPGRIAWQGDKLMLLGKVGQLDVCYIADEAAPGKWKEAMPYEFPENEPPMLNKSETLDVSQVEAAGKKAIEVARVWFTGDRKVLARIADFELKGWRLVGPYAMAWGMRSGKPASFSVEISTGEVLAGPASFGDVQKPFAFPVSPNPMVDANTKRR